MIMKLFQKQLAYLFNYQSLSGKINQFSRLLSGGNIPNKIRIVEVGPRDGLQNEKSVVPTKVKVELINRLTAAGLTTIEATSFVSPKWVPQMADHSDVMAQIKRSPGVSYPVLVPNLKGLDAAMKAGVEEIAIFSAASETFSQNNINTSIADSLRKLRQVAEKAQKCGLRIRGYVSCIVGCPYEGRIPPDKVLPVIESLLSCGCYEVSLGDTIGVGTPGSISSLLNKVKSLVGVEKLAIHCHDTYGQALVNVLVALDHGVSVIDSSIAGLGGCPYATGSSGNLATEDLVYMLHGMGIQTGVHLESLVETGRWISMQINRQNNSKVGVALKKNISH